MKFSTLNDLTGKRYGRLVVVKRGDDAEKHGTYWSCLCDCGAMKDISVGALRSGGTQSCGCLRRELAAQARYRHGQSHSDIHNIWTGMKTRCLNPKSNAYRHYGGRGISICDRWLTFENFFKDMGNRPTPKHSIDRRDNDGNYEPSNCRWATREQQARNKRLRDGSSSGITGVTKNGPGWSARIGVKGSIIRLYYGHDFFEACCRRKSAENKYWGVNR